MPRTPEHRADIHQLVTERRAQGLPVWESRVDIRSVWRNRDLPFSEKRDQIVAAIRATRWFKGEDEDSEVHEIVADLADAADAEEWDEWWDSFYDWCDWNRVWVDR